MEYQPRGGMCAVCTKWDKDCSKLPFYSMQALEVSKGGDAIIVKCEAFDRKQLRKVK